MDDKKYYYLKLKDNFFDSDEVIILESMQDGYIYSNILLKLYLRSLKNEGRLMFNNSIPYNSQMISNLTRHSVGDVEKAVKVLSELGLIEILDNGAIYMMDIQNFIGKSSTEADRKRAYRLKIEEEKKSTKRIGQIEGQMSDKNPPEKEKEKEKELERESEKESIEATFESDKKPKKPPRKKYGEFKHILLTEAQHTKLIKDYSESQVNEVITRMDEWIQLKGKPYKDFNLALRKWLKEDKTEQPKTPVYKDLGAE